MFEREQREWLATISNRPEHASEAARQELREWVAAISDLPVDELNGDEPEAWSPARQEFFDWLAAVSTAEIPAQYRARTNRSIPFESQASELPVNESRAAGSCASATRMHEQWDPAKHPRGGYPQNRGWWSPAGGTNSTTTTKPQTPQTITGTASPATTAPPQTGTTVTRPTVPAKPQPATRPSTTGTVMRGAVAAGGMTQQIIAAPGAIGQSGGKSEAGLMATDAHLKKQVDSAVK